MPKQRITRPMLTLRALNGGPATAMLPVTVHDAQKQQWHGAHTKKRSLERLMWGFMVLCVLAPMAAFAVFQVITG